MHGYHHHHRRHTFYYYEQKKWPVRKQLLVVFLFDLAVILVIGIILAAHMHRGPIPYVSHY